LIALPKPSVGLGFLALLSCIVFAGSGCESPIRTSYDWDPSVDIASYETYAWISEDTLIPPKTGEGEISYISPIDDQRIRRAVNEELAARGYVEAPSLEEAGFVVSYGIGREDKLEVYDVPGNTGPRVYPRGYGHGGGWYYGPSIQVARYTEGTLTIELFDRETKNALWIGWGSKRVDDSDDRDQVIRTAVEKILEPLSSRVDAPAAEAP
jgi:hypothetical protein